VGTGLENPTHILFVLVIALLVLGPKRLPELGRNLGRGIRDFRTSLNMDPEPAAAPPPPAASPAAVIDPPLAIAPLYQSDPATATVVPGAPIAETHPPVAPVEPPPPAAPADDAASPAGAAEAVMGDDATSDLAAHAPYAPPPAPAAAPAPPAAASRPQPHNDQ
jgi:sec-independent protein translocase protein TatA